MDCKDDAGNPMRWRIVLHFKILEPPDIAIDDMIAAMQKIYSSAGIKVECGSCVNINVAPADTVINLDGCDLPDCMGAAAEPAPHLMSIHHHHPHEDIATLFASSAGIPVDEVSVYIVFNTSNPPSQYGCSTHPAGRPGVILTAFAKIWTLAHEVGHVLGLPHDNDAAMMMYGHEVSRIKGVPKLEAGDDKRMEFCGPLQACKETE